MGLADTPAESLLRTKYSQFNDLNVNSLNISTGKKRVTIKSPSKRSASNPATPRQSNVETKLTPFEKAKRVLAAEAKEKELTRSRVKATLTSLVETRNKASLSKDHKKLKQVGNMI